jgi:hypothetical protein
MVASYVTWDATITRANAQLGWVQKWSTVKLLRKIVYLEVFATVTERAFSVIHPLVAIDQRLRRRTKRRLRDTRSVADSSLVHSSTLIPPHFSEPLTIVKITNFSATCIFVNYCTYLHNDDAI